MGEFQSSVNAPSPNSYVTPLADFSSIEKLPEQFYKGQAARRAEENATLFRNGIPKTAAGDPDYNAMAMRLYQGGDYATGTSMANQGITQEGMRLGQKYANEPVNPGETAAPPASGIPGGDNGETTLMSVLRKAGVPEGDAGKLALQAQRALGIADSNTPLTPQQMQSAVAYLQRLAQARGGASAAEPAPASAGPAGGAPADGVVAAPAAPEATGLPPQPPPTPQFEPPPGSGAPPTQTVDRDPRYVQAQQLYQRASTPGLPKQTAEGMTKRADALMKIVEETYKETPEQKSARASNMPLRQYQQEQESSKAMATAQAKERTEQYTNIRDLGQKAATELPQLAFIRKQMDTDPNFYSGFGTKYVTAWKQMTAGVARALPELGLDPNAAFSNESFGKVVSGNILNSLGLLKGLGPIRVAEMNLAKESSASANYTPQTNKFLLDLSMKLHERSQWIAEAAANYKNGQLDTGFDKIVAAFDKKNGITEMLKQYQTVLTDAQPQKYATPDDVVKAIQAGKLRPGNKFIDAHGRPIELDEQAYQKFGGR